MIRTKYITVGALLALPIVLNACASATQSSWSCRAVGNQTCASISEIDTGEPVSDRKADKRRGDGEEHHTLIFGGHAASWWDRNRPTAETREDEPRRENDQTMRILIAPYVDGQGDYHDRSIVYSVMRRAEWWIAPPVPVASQPPAGARVDTQPSPSQPTASSSSSSSSTAAAATPASTVVSK